MRTAYFDSSAIAKLSILERGSLALLDLLDEPCRSVTSALSWTEVIRTIVRLGRSRDEAEKALSGFFLVTLDHDVLQRAAWLEPSRLRALDAIHLASALSVRDPALEFVTYDERLAAAARTHGLPVVQPGV
jgi:predicted nucleic acid-binding protein